MKLSRRSQSNAIQNCYYSTATTCTWRAHFRFAHLLLFALHSGHDGVLLIITNELTAYTIFVFPSFRCGGTERMRRAMKPQMCSTNHPQTQRVAERKKKFSNRTLSSAEMQRIFAAHEQSPSETRAMENSFQRIPAVSVANTKVQSVPSRYCLCPHRQQNRIRELENSRIRRQLRMLKCKQNHAPPYTEHSE